MQFTFFRRHRVSLTMNSFSRRIAGLLVLVLASVSGCHMDISKLPPVSPAGPEGDMQPGFSVPTYSYVYAQVFQPYCISCHSNGGGNPHGVNLETYENTIQNLSDIETQALVNQAMPPTGPLPTFAQEILQQWINGGAPENGVVDVPGSSPTPAPGASPAPVPSPTPIVSPTPPPNLQPTYSLLALNIFTPKCVICHGPGGAESSKPLNSYAAIMGYVTAGNSSGSTLYQKISTGKMPPTGPLSQAEIQAVGAWIQNGAPNN